MITRRLRRVDVSAEHTERQLKRAEQECEKWEQKYEVFSTVLGNGERECADHGLDVPNRKQRRGIGKRKRISMTWSLTWIISDMT